MPLECKLTGAGGGKGTMYARNMPYTRPIPSRYENGKEPGRNRRDNENTEEREEMHCMGSRKWKAKGGNVKGRRVGLRSEKKGFNNNHIQIMRYS